MLEIQRGNDSIVRSLVNHEGVLINEPGEICKAFQEHFVQFFGWGMDGTDGRRDIADFLAGLTRLSEKDAESCEGPITAEEVIEAVEDTGLGK